MYTGMHFRRSLPTWGTMFLFISVTPGLVKAIGQSMAVPLTVNRFPVQGTEVACSLVWEDAVSQKEKGQNGRTYVLLPSYWLLLGNGAVTFAS